MMTFILKWVARIIEEIYCGIFSLLLIISPMLPFGWKTIVIIDIIGLMIFILIHKFIIHHVDND